MSLCLSRAVRRQHQLMFKGRTAFRNASSTAEAASAAKEKTGAAASKAQEGLSRVTSSAGSAISSAGSTAGKMLGGIGGRTGRLIGFVQSLIPPTIYYSRVGLELTKIIVKEQKMSPPSLEAFSKYMQPAMNAIRHPASLFTQASTSSAAQPTNILSRLRNMDNKQLTGVGIVAAEVLGFFTIGEMLGRLKVVGYRSSAPHEEH